MHVGVELTSAGLTPHLTSLYILSSDTQHMGASIIIEAGRPRRRRDDKTVGLVLDPSIDRAGRVRVRTFRRILLLREELANLHRTRTHACNACGSSREHASRGETDGYVRTVRTMRPSRGPAGRAPG